MVQVEKYSVLLLIFQNICRGWIVGLWVMLNLIMEQWLLGNIRSKVVNNIEAEEHSEPANL